MSKNISWDQDYSAEWIEQESFSGVKNEILDDGNYKFTIEKVVKRTSNGAKYKGAPMAEIHLVCGGALVREYIVLNTDFKQKIANLIRGVFGLNNPPPQMWDNLSGREITCKIERYEDEYEGNTFFKNRVVAFLAADLEHKIGPSEVQNASKPTPIKKQPLPKEAAPQEMAPIPEPVDDLPF